ncbi:MAG: 4-hydroxy-tetrahydrodipicolinate reductase [Phycisphaerae bacterium]|nr:4-hydroxy-tetrahydrodipicolinate reductase [Phycisphaerae bacterium]NUQ45142.1 4-hydroxy-tetrahydrodipicolinate reductase [Phycisphaerae bacterium]
MPTSIAIHGAAGRMGRHLIALASQDRAFSIAGALESQQCPMLGRDAGEIAGCGRIGIPIESSCGVPFDVMIDFSAASATPRALDVALKAHRPIVIGTTGHDASGLEQIERASERIAVLHAANMSMGINVLLRIVGQLTAALGTDYDVEIVEAHHRFKIDAPSGTALALVDAIRCGQSTGAATSDVVHGRHGMTGGRPGGQIGVHAIRLGDTVGEHTVCFGGLGETIKISHTAHSRETFARGALRAAKWIAGRPAGRYSMNDILFGSQPIT